MSFDSSVSKIQDPCKSFSHMLIVQIYSHESFILIGAHPTNEVTNHVPDENFWGRQR